MHFVVTRKAKADKVVIGQCQLGIYFQLFDVMDDLCFSVSAVLTTLNTLVAIALEYLYPLVLPLR